MSDGYTSAQMASKFCDAIVIFEVSGDPSKLKELCETVIRSIEIACPTPRQSKKKKGKKK